MTQAAPPPEPRFVSSDRWAQAVTAVLIAVFIAVGWIQVRQSQLISSAIYYNEENISWIFPRWHQLAQSLSVCLRLCGR